jgi:lipopolysaccharide biosynthesis glycosyltransferase
MEKNKNSITIVTVCNNAFSVLLATLIKSIEINYFGREEINLFIVNDHINPKNLERINQSVDGNKIKLTVINIDDILPMMKKLPLDFSSFPLNVYVRIFIAGFLPKEIKKAIYLDVDMIVRKDVSELWNIPLGQHIIAGVPDRSQVISSSWGGIENYRELGLNGNWKYYNSGLLVINLERWRETNLSVEIINCIEKNKKHAIFPDQYGLNVIFANKWLELDKRWNTYAPDSEIDPYIIHFIGKKPIYKSYDGNKIYKLEFHKYLKLTAFRGAKDLSETSRMFIKITYKIEKILLSNMPNFLKKLSSVGFFLGKK